jgi:transposase
VGVHIRTSYRWCWWLRNAALSYEMHRRLEGTVEADELYHTAGNQGQAQHGGKKPLGRRPCHRRKKRDPGRGHCDKDRPAKIAWVSLQGPIVVQAVKDFTVKTVQQAADLAAHAGSQLYTDSASSYWALKGYLHAFCTQLQQQRGVWVSVATMCRVLKRLGLPRKKSPSTPPNARRRASTTPALYRQRLATLDLRRLKFVDEAGVNRAMTRLYGLAPKGERVVGTIPQNYGDNITLLGALDQHGIQAVLTVNGATDADVFRAYVTQVLGPTLVPGDIVVLDNLAAHKVVGVQQALARRGARLLYLPPYSPDLSPMVLCVSKLKTALRAAKARTREALETAIRAAMEAVTALDACHWFRHCG